MSHVGIRFGSHLPCQELEAAEFLTSWDTPTAGLGYVLEMRQKVGNCSKSRFSTEKSGFQQKTAHKQVLDPRPDFSWDIGLQGIYIYIYMGVSENSVPLNPMVLLILIPIKLLFRWEYTQHFQTNPYTFTCVLHVFECNPSSLISDLPHRGTGSSASSSSPFSDSFFAPMASFLSRFETLPGASWRRQSWYLDFLLINLWRYLEISQAIQKHGSFTKMLQ